MPSLLHQLGAHDQVLVEKLAWMGAIGTDPTDDGGQVQDCVRPHIAQTCRDLIGPGEIVVGVRRGDDVRKTSTGKHAQDVLAEESAAPGDQKPHVP